MINIHSRLLGKYELDQVKPSIYIKNIKLLKLFEKLKKMNDKETIISLIEASIAKNKK